MRLQTAATLSLVAALAAAPCLAGVRWNASASMPRGLWQFTLPQDVPRRGQVVGLCLPPEWGKVVLSRTYAEAGPCPSGHEPLLKPVAAVPGDVVEVSAEGVRVNGAFAVPLALPRDAGDRPLDGVPPGRYPVAPGTLWVLSGHDPRSFDSRYFGALAFAAVVAEARPVLVGR